MGTWGTGILSDDLVMDIRGDYLDLFNRGTAPEAILRKILATYDDYGDTSLVWLAIAKTQWDCGHLRPKILTKVRHIIEKGEDLELWAEAGPKTVAARKRSLNQFLAQLQTPNPHPRRPRKAIKRKPIFQPGDCLAVRLEDGDWGAVLVLRGPPESDDPYTDTYGNNLAVTLHYKSPAQPTLAIFEKRQWLYVTHHEWKRHMDISNVMALRFKSVKDRFVLIGNIPLRKSDPATSNSYSVWQHMTEQMFRQDQWDRGIRK